MVMQTNGINYYTPGWNNGTYIPPVQNPMGGYTAPQYVPQPAIPQPQQTFVTPNQIRPVNGRVVSSENDITPNDVPMVEPATVILEAILVADILPTGCIPG